MTSHSASRSVLWIAVTLAVCALLGISQAMNLKSAELPPIGVVDLNKLVHEAPEYPKLAKLDYEICCLESKIEMEPLERHRSYFHGTDQQLKAPLRGWQAEIGTRPPSGKV